MSQDNKNTTTASNHSTQGTVVKLGRINTQHAQSYIADMLFELKSLAHDQGLTDLSQMIGLTHRAAALGLGESQ